MSDRRNVTLWEARSVPAISDATTDVPQILAFARQLRERERAQLVSNIQAGNYEVATTFVWHRTMILLKNQLAKLGNQFISELLQRPDIDDWTDLTVAISETEAISLARDLGMLTPTQAMRLGHSQEVVNHFASVDGDTLEDDEMMTMEEAIGCLRVCVQGILGHESITVAEDFAAFRQNLESQTFTNSSPDIVRLRQSPYLFVRTAISVLLSVLRAGKGAQLEHASRNALLIIPMFWAELKKPERWQVGQAYATEFNEGRKESIRALHAVLLTVKGFDYVPESLRTNMFTQVASSVIAAHEGMDNFHNEPGPMRELANLGSSIPGPALAACITAALCVKLGNSYGTSWAAQADAEKLLKSISKERWIYYLDGRLERDFIILRKLVGGAPQKNWMAFASSLGLDPADLTSKDIRALLNATNKGNSNAVGQIASRLIVAE